MGDTGGYSSNSGSVDNRTMRGTREHMVCGSDYLRVGQG